MAAASSMLFSPTTYSGRYLKHVGSPLKQRNIMAAIETELKEFIKNTFDTQSNVNPLLFQRKSEDINLCIDKLLHHASTLGIADGDEMPLQDLDMTFNTWLMLVNMKLFNGKLRSLNSIVREGDVNVTLDGSGFNVQFFVKFGNMEIVFDRYDLNSAFLKRTGCVKAKINKNIIQVECKLFPCDKGIAKSEFLNLINIKQFDDIDVEVTGFGYFDSFMSKVLSWLTIAYNTQLKTAIELIVIEYLPLKINFKQCLD